MIKRDEMMTDIMTIKEVADYLKINEKTIYKLAKEKRIPAFKVGGNWRFKKNTIDEWIEKNMYEEREV
jgi:excisionase family DNA binding protein